MKFGWNLVRIEKTKRSIVNSLTQLKLNEIDRAEFSALLFSLLRSYIYIDDNFYHRVVGQHVHERSGHVPTMNGVPQSPLIMVPSVEEDRVRPLLQQPIHSRGNSRYSPHAARLLPLLTRSGSWIGLLEPGKEENRTLLGNLEKRKSMIVLDWIFIVVEIDGQRVQGMEILSERAVG